METNVHFSSKTHTWETPQWFFDELNAEFHFTLDPCAEPETAKCAKFYTYRQNGLAKDWTGERVFCNPPYGREMPRWIEKAATSDALVVCLVPARTDTRWWAKFWDYDRHCPIDGCEVRFLPKRLRFVGMEKDAPFPVAVVIFRPLQR
jgi:phage N-6-adenine-methyltransferase